MNWNWSIKWKQIDVCNSTKIGLKLISFYFRKIHVVELLHLHRDFKVIWLPRLFTREKFCKQRMRPFAGKLEDFNLPTSRSKRYLHEFSYSLRIALRVHRSFSLISLFSADEKLTKMNKLNYQNLKFIHIFYQSVNLANWIWNFLFEKERESWNFVIIIAKSEPLIVGRCH